MSNIPEQHQGPNLHPAGGHQIDPLLHGRAPNLPDESAVTPALSFPLPVPTRELLGGAQAAHALGKLESAYCLRYAVASGLQEQGPPQGTPLQHDPAFAGALSSLLFAARNLYPKRLDEMADLSARAVAAIVEDLDSLNRASNVHNVHYSTLLTNLPSARLHAGVLTALAAIQKERASGVKPSDQWESAQAFTDAAWRGSSNLRTDYPGLVDQNRINTAPRQAAISGLSGKPIRGMGVALKGVMLAPLSESPRWSQNSTPELGRSGRLRAKAKTLAGSVAAGAVCALNTRVGRAFGGRSKALNLYARMERGDLSVPQLKHPED